jgi:BirA family biotin operon repressor/biotin-[acetyl-CoA-carboxylase] ligase
MASVAVPTRDLRSPMRAAALTRGLVRPGSVWSKVEVVAETGSTNADVAELALAGAAEGLVLVAECQQAGRGRMGRSWQVPAGAGLTMSTLLRPPVTTPGRLGWLPLLAGVAVAEACAELPCRPSSVEAALKWPNDLLVRSLAGGWGKCGGILAEAQVANGEPGGALPPPVIVGIGINVSQVDSELPPPVDPRAYPPTSLTLAGASCDRERLAVMVLRSLSDWYGRWLAAAADPIASGLREAYRSRCLTLGREVTVMLPTGASVCGRATDVDEDGRLVVATATGLRLLAAGEVHHIRQ